MVLKGIEKRSQKILTRTIMRNEDTDEKESTTAEKVMLSRKMMNMKPRNTKGI